MKPRFVLMILAGIPALVGVGLFYAFRWHSDSDYRLSDGSVLHLERVEYASHDDIHRTFDPSMGWWADLKRQVGWRVGGTLGHKLADSVHGYLTSTGVDAPFHTNIGSLRIWMVERSGMSGALRDFELRSGEVVDDHGCVFRATRISGDYYGPSSGYPGRAYNSWLLTFEAFPRRESQFRLRVLEGKTKTWAEYRIANLTQVTQQEAWTTQPLPITRTNGGVEVILTAIEIKTDRPANGRRPGPAAQDSTNAPYAVAPRFEFREDGQPTTAWRAEGIELWDSSSNVTVTGYGYPGQTLLLCPQEPAWRLKAQCYGSEEAHAASNEVWAIRGVEVTGPGKLAVNNTNHEFAAASVRWLAIAGPGAVDYSNRTPCAATSAPLADSTNAVKYTYQPGRGRVVMLISSGCQIALRVGGGSPGQALTVRAVDGEGRSYYAEAWKSGRGGVVETNAVHYLDQRLWADLMCLVVRLPPDVKTVDLFFCIHNPKTEEFVFKPPRN